jgi:hypothetical protein
MKIYEIAQIFIGGVGAIALIVTLLIQNGTWRTQQRQVNDQTFFKLLDNLKYNATQVKFISRDSDSAVYLGSSAFKQMKTAILASLERGSGEDGYTQEAIHLHISRHLFEYSEYTYLPYLLSFEILGLYLLDRGIPSSDKEFYVKTIQAHLSREEKECLKRFTQLHSDDPASIYSEETHQHVRSIFEELDKIQTIPEPHIP